MLISMRSLVPDKDTHLLLLIHFYTTAASAFGFCSVATGAAKPLLYQVLIWFPTCSGTSLPGEACLDYPKPEGQLCCCRQ